jgi:autotransporter-associated beta strand protein
MHPLRILNLSHVVLRTCLAVLVSILLMPGLAHALVFTPPAADLPVTIPAPNGNGIFINGNTAFAESIIDVQGIATSISAVKCGVWLTYPNIGALTITLTSPDGTVVVLADEEGQVNTGNDNGLGGLGGVGGTGGVGGGVGGVGTTGANGSYGIGAAPAPGGVVEFDDTATQSIDQFRGQAVDTIPSATYTCTTQPGLILTTTGNNKLAKFKGKADLNVNGNWTLTVYNNDLFFDGFNGGTQTGQETGTINWWTLEIDEVGAHVWTGGGFGPTWSQNGNWSNGAPLVTEQKVVLIFPASAAQYDPNNNIAGLTLGQVTIEGDYTITGDACTATGNALFQNLGGTSTWGIPLGLVYPLDGLFGPNGSTLQATGITIEVFAGQLTMSGVISGGGAPAGADRGPATITTEGPGTLVLSGANSYPGATNIESGIVDAQSATALGNPAGAGGGGFVAAGATLQLGVPGAASPFATFAEPLTIISVGVGSVGALELVSTGAVNYTGLITLASGDAAIGAVAGGTLTVNNLTGGGLTFEGQGATSVLNINAALPGDNLISNNGTVNVENTNSVPNLAVNNGGTVAVLAGSLSVLNSISSGPSATTNAITGNLVIPAGQLPITVAGGGATPSLIISLGTLTGPGALSQVGTGTLELDCTGGGIGYTVSQGTLSGSAQLGTLSVLAGAVVQPGVTATGTGNMGTSGDANLAAGSLFVSQIWGGATLNVLGNLSLSGAMATGAGGAYLSPVGGGAGLHTIINYGTITPSAFVNRPYPGSAASGITYGAPGPANCIQLNLDGSTVSLVNATYTLSKAAGNVPIAVTWGGTVNANASSDLVAVPGTAIQAQDFNQPTPTPLLESAGTNFTLPIVQNYIAEGNTTFDLLLVPMGQTTAAHGNSSANVTIIDNQDSGYEKKRCGIGSGFTVFFLFAIGLAMRALYLRRR